MRDILFPVDSILGVPVNSMSVSIFLHSVFSCTHSTLTRILVTKFFFDYPIVIMMMQSALTLLTIEAARVLGIVKLPAYTLDRARATLFPSVMFALSAWLTLTAYESISLPAYDSVKRFIALAVLAVTFYRGATAGAGGHPIRIERRQVIAVFVIGFLAAIAVNLEMTIDRYSLVYGFGGVILQTAMIILFESISHIQSPLELVYMNSFNCLVLFLLADLVEDEIRDAFMYVFTSATPLFNGILAATLIFSVLSHVTFFVALEKANALCVAITGNVRAAVQVIVTYYLSLYLFYDIEPTMANWFGVIGAFAGGVWFLRTEIVATTRSVAWSPLK